MGRYLVMVEDGTFFTEKLWVCASPFKGIISGRLRSSPLGWDGSETCAISNRPREKKIS
ncbi:MAG: hypothetical protein F6K23_34565 [Okeania sp. SIO2C9]|uniref:hypothetical protein n=1 Tax=Okeania sp. SIO2C9 TaxID=2607791 RepID=UPI0013BFA5B6|nr:hypothetical protein [Okeania sp. SIO2C9]NEQ77692.1 hypothetical protein [Okeania sp. SIO2C9]